MWGFVLGFGLASYPLMRGRLDKRVFAFGILSLVAIFFFVMPFLGIALQFINLSAAQSGASATTAPQAGILLYLINALIFLVGFSGYTIAVTIYSGMGILVSIGNFAVALMTGASNAASQLNQVPGVAPIIPGITIPLAAGVISLAILLIVHEVSHGVLARQSKVKIKSVGLLLFGILPCGGFVEPDDRMVRKLNSRRQTGIYSAGVAANFVAMIAFFLLTMLISSYVGPAVYPYGEVVSGVTPGYPAYNVIATGSQVLCWNSHAVTNISTLQSAAATDVPNSTVTVITSVGGVASTYKFKAVASPANASRGIIGVSLSYVPIISGAVANLVYFLYTLFALSMLLNFFVAVFNLLPLPFFDGWSIYRVNIKSKRVVYALGIITFAALCINALPWLFYL